MPPPPNQTSGTAIDLGSLPASVSQDVHDAGTTYTVWYKFTAPNGVNVTGVFGFGGAVGVGYRPTTFAYHSSDLTTSLTSGQNKPIQFPVTAGELYYLKFVPNAGNPTPAILTLTAYIAPVSPAPTGSLFVNDDTNGFPGVLLSQADGAVLRFVSPFPAGEAGDILPSGIMCVEDISTTPDSIKVIAADFATIIASIVGNPRTLAGSIRANPTLNRFYALNKTTNPDQILAINPDGSLFATYTMTGHNDLEALAVADDGTTMYWGANTGADGKIYRWDLNSGSALSDFANSGTSTFIWDIFVLAGGDVLASFINATGEVAVVRRYNSSGTLLNTYTFTGESDLDFPLGTPPRIARGPDDASFWIWTHHDGGISKFRLIRIVDGVVLTSFTRVEFEEGLYNGAETATPLDDFGNSFSCYFFALPVALGVGEGSGSPGVLGIIGPLIWVEFPRRVFA